MKEIRGHFKKSSNYEKDTITESQTVLNRNGCL